MKRSIYAFIAIVIMLLMLASAGCKKSVIESPDGPTAVIPGEIVKPGENEPPKQNSGTPYINEKGEEDILPEKTPSSSENNEVQYFVPDNPKGFDESTEEFIKNSMSGMSYEEIVKLWGEGDMNQQNGVEGVTAYFITSRDIIIRYNTETGEITDITVDNH